MIVRATVAALGAILLLVPFVRATDSASPAEIFVHEMLGGVGAVEVDCPQQVVERIKSREMQVVCARFEGDFVSFESRWTLHILQDTMFQRRYGGGTIPEALPQTGWEVSGATHDRIYVVGDSTLGVRFTLGEILMVFK